MFKIALAILWTYVKVVSVPASRRSTTRSRTRCTASRSIRALEAGKHVLCEKPMSSSPAEVAGAFAAAERSGFLLTEAFMYRHHPQARRLAALVAEGAIGELRLIRSTFSYGLYDEANIRLRMDVDGGSLMDVGCYCISGSRMLAGEPEAVFGRAYTGHRHGLGVRRLAALPRRRAGAVRLRDVPPRARRARGDRVAGLALPRRSVALPEPRDRAAHGGRRRAHRDRGRRIRTSSSSRISAARSAPARPRCSAATTRSRRRA